MMAAGGRCLPTSSISPERVGDRLEERRVLFGDDIQYYDPELHNNVRVEYAIRTNIGAECYCAAELQEALDIERNKMLVRLQRH